MEERISLPPQPKTAAEYRAAIQAILQEIRRLFAEMDRNQAEIDRMRTEIDAVGARTDTALQALQAQLEDLRKTGRPDAQRPA
jgi:uncharacterized protein YlxW (UPF0749 family)